LQSGSPPALAACLVCWRVLCLRARPRAAIRNRWLSHVRRLSSLRRSPRTGAARTWQSNSRHRRWANRRVGVFLLGDVRFRISGDLDLAVARMFDQIEFEVVVGPDVDDEAPPRPCSPAPLHDFVRPRRDRTPVGSTIPGHPLLRPPPDGQRARVSARDRRGAFRDSARPTVAARDPKCDGDLSMLRPALTSPWPGRPSRRPCGEPPPRAALGSTPLTSREIRSLIARRSIFRGPGDDRDQDFRMGPARSKPSRP